MKKKYIVNLSAQLEMLRDCVEKSKTEAYERRHAHMSETVYDYEGEVSIIR